MMQQQYGTVLAREAMTPDEEFCYRAFRAAREPLRPFRDDERLLFIRLDPSRPRISGDFEVQVNYWRMRKAGQSHKMAEMLALRKFPGLKGTSSSFMQGTHHQDTPVDHYRYQAAQAAGVDTNGKRYLSGLARYPNDPEAWVGGLDDVRRVVAGRGWNCTGALDHQGYQPGQAEPAPDVPIAPELVARHVASRLADYDPAERSPALIADIADRATQELTGRVNLDPEPKVAAYDDPFAHCEGE